MSRASGVALALLFACAGCKDPRTEVVGIVSTSGVRIPDDVDTIHIAITSMQSSSARWDADYPLCAAGQSPASGTCYDVPFTMTMIPGKAKPGDAVRVQVDATRRGTPVISDAALFTFTKGKSLRLDFVLYANCLGNVSCAMRDQSCGPDAQCQSLMPQPFSGEPDLGSLPPKDLGPHPGDGGVVDMKKPGDGGPIDLGPGDMAHPPNCKAVCINNNQVCGALLNPVAGCQGYDCGGCATGFNCVTGQCIQGPPPDMGSRDLATCESGVSCPGGVCGTGFNCVGGCCVPNATCDLPAETCCYNGSAYYCNGGLVCIGAMCEPPDLGTEMGLGDL